MRRLATVVPMEAVFSTRGKLGTVCEPEFGGSLDYGFDIRDIPHFFLPAIRLPLPSKFGPIHTRVKREIWQRNPDVTVVSGWNMICHWQFALATLSLGVPLLIRAEATSDFFHGSICSLPVRLFLIRYLCSRASGFLSIGSSCTQFYRQLGIPKGKIFSTPYAVDNEFFFREKRKWSPHRAQTLTRLGMNPENKTLLFSGKLINRKRPLDALYVKRKLKKRGIETNLVFLGDGPLRQQLEEECQNDKNVSITGFQNQKEIGRFYAVGDVFLFPSSEETWGLVVNEAMCFGMPVITTQKVGSAKDLLGNTGAGFVHEVGNIDAMAENVTCLIKSPDILKRMGSKAADAVRWASFANDIQGIRQAMGALGID
jgi:glycosyltransferase involved in cell wall biosynthesis